MKLFDSLFCYPWTNPAENNANSYFVAGSVPTLIDVGHLRHVTSLLQAMERDGMSPEKIELIISTHLHPDHHEGVIAFHDTEIMVTFHQEEARHLRDFGYMLYQGMGLTLPPTDATFFLQDGTLRLGEHEFEVYHTPGHSPGSVSLYWPTYEVLFTGDVVFAQGVGRTDFYEGDGEALKESVMKLARLDVEYLLPGHGPVIKGKTNVQDNFQWIRERMFPLM